MRRTLRESTSGNATTRYWDNPHLVAIFPKDLLAGLTPSELFVSGRINPLSSNT
ncbi:MAG: hypothetical protein H6999_02745 [Hahellaceae bacterium]|nr:hypothetical protein [Hahellaceae bacterium]MCP5168661.1 hypothetical protein [Hahellaceae bacterium]